MTTPAPERCRLDVWLWRARLYKTRSQAANAVETRRVRLIRGAASSVAPKPSTQIGPGDGIVVLISQRLRSLEVLAVGTRRGPATEARALYAEVGPALDDPASGDHSDAPKDSA